jgi:hypothetical protein
MTSSTESDFERGVIIPLNEDISSAYSNSSWEAMPKEESLLNGWHWHCNVSKCPIKMGFVSSLLSYIAPFLRLKLEFPKTEWRDVLLLNKVKRTHST